MLIKAGKEKEGIAALKAFLERQPSSAESEEARKMIANPKLAGEPFARSFKVKSTAGEELSLEKFKGKVVLLDFWAAWCGPCRVEMPEVKRIWKKDSSEPIRGCRSESGLEPRALSWMKQEVFRGRSTMPASDGAILSPLYGVKASAYDLRTRMELIRG